MVTEPEERLTFPLRVGVVGHRTLIDPEGVRTAIHAALRDLQERFPGTKATRVTLDVLSPLADGADRLVAQAVLRFPGATLHAVLPCPPDVYVSDFQVDSQIEFRKLLSHAVDIDIPHQVVDREEGYERAGQIVIDLSDIVIAVWDGRETGLRAGTAPGVARARKQEVPLVLIDPGNPGAWHADLGRGLPEDDLSEFDAFNRASLGEERFGRAMRHREDQLRITGTEWAAALIEWHLPLFVRADILANRYRRLYHAFSDGLFLLGALALVAVGTQLVFFPHRPGVASVEVALLVVLLAVLLAGRRLKLHDRSVAYRFLAERLRASLFLAAVGATPSGDSRPFLPHDAERWPRRAFRQIWEERPRVSAPAEASDSARRFVLEGWVHEQLEYFSRSAHRHERRLQLLEGGSIALFGSTVILALLHAVGAGHREHESTWWAQVATLLTVALPAFAVAFAGIRTQRDHARNELRYAHMRERTEIAKANLKRPLSIDQLRSIVGELDADLLNENRDWLFAMLIQGKPELGA